MHRVPCALVVAGLNCAIHLNGQYGFELNAKVVLEDGSPMVSSPIVTLHIPGSRADCIAKELFGNGTLRLRVPPGFIQGEPQTGCNISVLLSGYRPFSGYVQDGTTIVLHRLGVNEGASVSAASLNVPPAAKKEYEAGEGAASRRKWAQAEQHFRNAVELHPSYAIAWSELGQSLVEQNHLDEATEAIHKAREADPHYLKPLVQLAAISSVQQQWSDELKYSDQVIQQRTNEYPAAHFYYAEATFHLGDVKNAEKLTREAIQLDTAMTCPESLVLLGEIFEKQGNNDGAAAEYKSYLKVAPHGTRTAEAKNSLARLNLR